MIDEAMEILKSEEGFVPYAYQDHLGYWTIGYGFLIDESKGGSLPKKIAEYWLHHEVFSRWTILCTKLPWLIQKPEGVQLALTLMAYQLGVAGVLKFKLMLAALEIDDRKLASKEALRSKWAEQTPARARRVAALLHG